MIIFGTLKNFWSHVQWGAAHGLGKVAFFELFCEAQIGDDYVHVADEALGFLNTLKLQTPLQHSIDLYIFEMDQNIGELEVSMNYVHVIYGFEALNYLAKKIASFLLVESTSELTKIIQITSIAILHE